MFKNFTEKTLNFLGIEKDLEIKDVINSDKNVKIDEEICDDSNIFKIPKYLERVRIFFEIKCIYYKGHLYRFHPND